LQQLSGYYDRKTAWNMDYRQYMEKQAMVKDISSAIQRGTDQQIIANAVIGANIAHKIDDTMYRMQTGIQSSIAAQTYTIVASQDALKRTIQNGFDSVNNTLDMGFTGVSKQLGIMTSSFTMGMVGVTQAIEKMTEEICSRLDKIHNVLNNPLLIQSRELYRRALTNYTKGFFEEALEDIKQAVEKNKTDYISWFLEGEVYAFGAGEFSNVINLDEAINAYSQALKYNKPDIAESEDAGQLAAEIWFYLGLAQYAKSNELLRAKKDAEAQKTLDQALISFECSYQYSDKMLEALYNAARCRALSGNKDGTIDYLRTVILNDRNYAVKAVNDSDFEDLRDTVYRLIEELKQEVFSKAKADYDSINAMLAEIVAMNETLPDKWLRYISGAFPKEFTGKAPYFDILDSAESFKKILQFLQPFISGRKEKAAALKRQRGEDEKSQREREEIENEIRRVIAEYRNPVRRSGESNSDLSVRLFQQYRYFYRVPLDDEEQNKNAATFNIPHLRRRWEPVLIANKELCREAREAAHNANSRIEKNRTIKGVIIALGIIALLVFIVSKCVSG
jgi:tetratricopeptide (TPR) repeat protein